MKQVQSVAIRVDASLMIGTGHVMRCLTLADELRNEAVHCHFICRAHVGNLNALIRERGFAVTELPNGLPDCTETGEAEEFATAYAHWLGVDWRVDVKQTRAILAKLQPDWLVVDHYALDRRWETALRSHYHNLMVIDDLADRPHRCELLLDQNLGRQPQDYANLVPAQCKVLIGPQYALLRPEFAALRTYSLQRRQQPVLKHVLIFMGGVDQPNATGEVLLALKGCALSQDCRISVVMGLQAPWLQQVRAQAQDMPWPTEVLVNISNMAQHMADSDLAIGAAGSTSWERCCLGLPALIAVSAANQKNGAAALADSGCALLLGDVAQIKTTLAHQIQVVQQPERLVALSQASYEVSAGQGAKKITGLLLFTDEMKINARPAKMSDELLLFEWANDKTTRANAFNPDPILLLTHKSWLMRRLKHRETCRMFIFENDQAMPVGQVRFDRDELMCWGIDFSLAPMFRGLGLGKRMLSAAIDIFKKEYPGGDISGVVKINNEPSRRAFESLGFVGYFNAAADVMIYRRTLDM